MSIHGPEDFHIHEHPEEIENLNELANPGFGDKAKNVFEWAAFLAVLIPLMIYTHVFLRGDKK